jgi:hypothetical protein
MLPYFSKHIPVLDLPQIIVDRFSGDYSLRDGVAPRLIGTDYTAFESHFVAEFMRICEFELYSHAVSLLPEGKHFMSLMNGVVAGLNLIDFKFVRASIQATRMSGEMNTSLGNGFSNLMLFLFLTRKCADVDCLVEGDDCLGRYVGPKLTTEDYAKLGFTVKIDYFSDPCLASFCGQVFDVEDRIIITDPIKQILNLGWAHIMYTNASSKTKNGLLRSKSLSLLYQFNGCPILTSLCQCMLRLTSGVKPVVDASESKYRQNWIRNVIKEKILIKKPSLRTRYIMMLKYGISISSQLDLESYFDNMNKIQPLWHPAIYDFVKPDVLDYGLRFVLPYGGTLLGSFGSRVQLITLKELYRVINAAKAKKQ